MAAFVEGRQYRNPKTGQMLLRKDGGWVKAPIGPGIRPAAQQSSPQNALYPAFQQAQYSPDMPGTSRSGEPIEPDADAAPMRRQQEPQYSPAPTEVAAGGQGAINVYQKKNAEWRGKNDAEFAQKSREATTASAMLLPTLDDLENLVDKTPVGPFSGLADLWGKMPDGVPGSEYDDNRAAIKSKVTSIVLPLARKLAPVSNTDFDALIKTIGAPNTPRGAFKQAITLLRREARAAIAYNMELKKWIQLYGNPDTPDPEGRTFEQAFVTWYNDPAVLKQLEEPGPRIKKNAPKNAPLQLYRDREGRIRSR